MTFSDWLKSLQNKTVAIIGIGVSNTPLIRLLARSGVQVTACDKASPEAFGNDTLLEELRTLGVRLQMGEGYLDGLDQDYIFRSPGIRPDLPAFQAAVARGSCLTSEMEVFFDVCPCHKIAVTGSDGKTTTTTIIARLLEAAGYTVHLGGNIGTPLLDQAGQMQPEDYAVLELSSFQLMTMHASPEIAVITNLAPNHLDVHRDMDEYIRAKENIFVHGGEGSLLAANMDNDIAFLCSRKAPGGLRYFSRRYKRAFAFCDQKGGIFLNGSFLMNAGDIRLPGVHNIENYMAAFCALYGLVSPGDMVQVAKEFGGVEHRLELVRTLNGVNYYNDSIGTSPSRTIAGLNSFDRKVILIAGGYDKHIPFEPLGPEVIKHVKALYLCGATEEKIYQAVVNTEGYSSERLPIYFYPDYPSMLKDIKERASCGDIVLFSPACAAFDRFPNFMKRGEYFKELVMGL